MTTIVKNARTPRAILGASAFALASLALMLSVTQDAAAQTYPTKPVRLMVGAPAGGGTDIVARMLGEKLTDTLKQPFVVDNRPGASNTIAADVTAKSSPDGHTLLVATTTGQAIAPHLLKLNFDALKDLTPVALVMVVPNVLIVGPSVSARDVRELVAQMKAKPDSFNFASSGAGSTQHLAGEAFKKIAGVSMTHIPYKGSSQAHADMLSGQAQLMFDTTSSAIGQIKGGKLRALAVTSSKRSPLFPEVPTVDEAGLPGYEDITFNGLVAPAGTPREILLRINSAVASAVRAPELHNRFLERGIELTSSASPEEFAAYLKAEIEKKGRLAREAGIKQD